jgi:hypothetical protein
MKVLKQFKPKKFQKNLSYYFQENKLGFILIDGPRRFEYNNNCVNIFCGNCEIQNGYGMAFNPMPI